MRAVTECLLRFEPALLRQAQVAQVAELKGKVAELTAKCSTMERALSQQTLGQTGSPVGASPLKGRQLQIKTKPSGQGSGLLDGGDARALPLSPPAASPSAHTPATPVSDALKHPGSSTLKVLHCAR